MATEAHHCPRCGADNGCALASTPPRQRCWCSELPPLPPPEPGTPACLCRACLATAAGSEPR